jgi:exodeoxyribonuclease-5
LGAILRGPLVGLTEEELLDVIWALPRSEERPDALPRLDLGVEASDVKHPLARSVIERLQVLYRRTNSTTPQDLLAQAVDVMRVRPILVARHRGQAERALANVDLYLSLASAFTVRGLRAFAEAMTAAWADEARAVEGRPDAQEEAVALYTMHAAKGLEWPIVVPVNTMTGIMPADSAVVDRGSDTFYCPVFGVKPAGYDEAREAEKAELDRERVRLWYVAATRARELLVLPRLDVAPSKSAWISLLDLSLADLPSLDVAHLPLDMGSAISGEGNEQTRERFAAEAAAIARSHRRLTWLAPSRDESSTGPVLTAETMEVWAAHDERQPEDEAERASIQGGRERGLVLHKLLEEVLTGETAEDVAALTERARSLVAALGRTAVEDPSRGLSPDELAACVTRTLALPEIAMHRPDITPELPVYASALVDEVEQATAGIADAIALGPDGTPQMVFDWKSDVMPTAETIDHYRSQVRTYLEMTGAARGLIVLVTTGEVIPVTPPTRQAALV